MNTTLFFLIISLYFLLLLFSFFYYQKNQKNTAFLTENFLEKEKQLKIYVFRLKNRHWLPMNVITCLKPMPKYQKPNFEKQGGKPATYRAA
jgi:hypothetical protein